MTDVTQPVKPAFDAYSNIRDLRKPDIDRRVDEIVAREDGAPRVPNTLRVKCACGWEMDDESSVVLEARKLHPCPLPPPAPRGRALKLKLKPEQAQKGRDNSAYRKWTKELVTAAYVAFHAKHDRAPRVIEHNSLNELPAVKTVLTLYGSIETGLASAGLKKPVREIKKAAP